MYKPILVKRRVYEKLVDGLLIKVFFVLLEKKNG